MYPTDTDLEMDITHYSNIVLFLTELKERRSREAEKIEKQKLIDSHIPISGAYVKGSDRVHTVACSCGKVTKYKKPLKTLEDFECPKKVMRG